MCGHRKVSILRSSMSQGFKGNPFPFADDRPPKPGPKPRPPRDSEPPLPPPPVVFRELQPPLRKKKKKMHCCDRSSIVSSEHQCFKHSDLVLDSLTATSSKFREEGFPRGESVVATSNHSFGITSMRQKLEKSWLLRIQKFNLKSSWFTFNFTIYTSSSFLAFSAIQIYDA